MNYKIIKDGSITSAKGFLASGIKAGLKRSGNLDMALIFSEFPALATAAFTANAFAAPPVIYDREIIKKGNRVQAIIINSGNANACTGEQGLRDAHISAEAVARHLQLDKEKVLVSSTGRIGVPMPMDIILNGIDLAVQELSADGGLLAADAIMTTDTIPKSFAVNLEINGKTITIGGMTKGAGMIAPKLKFQPPQATMLAYLTTDANLSKQFLEKCLAESLDKSFNRITVDGDTSTNDTFVALSNGEAGNKEIMLGTPQATLFQEAFNAVVSKLAREMVLDGEGVTRFVELSITGAKNDDEARQCAEAIANSALCKTAWFGADPNWGRIICAAGYSGVEIATKKVTLDYEGLPIMRNGGDAGTPEEEQVKAIDKREFRIDLDLGVANGSFTIWTCDLTYEYVKINADYHT